jgi:aryl-alcohol dehydrogenase-like predicted oxidoreductase
MNHTGNQSTTRRDAIKLGLLAWAGLAFGRRPAPYGETLIRAQDLTTRPIPKTGEQLPVVGLGTNQWGVQSEEEIAPLREIIRLMTDNGARVIDTARVYGRGRAEEVVGQVVRELDVRDDVFIATKVRTPESREEGIASLEACLNALGVDRVSAMRAHSISGAEILFPILREWKEAGRIRYFGDTTMSSEEYPELERQIRDENMDIIEIDYSVLDRAAADRILPLAQDRGVAVMIARPFGGRSGSIFSHVAGRPLPDFASEIGASSWAQLCLKYILANPAATVVIPGTDDPEHIVDNMGAARGEFPDADLCRRIEQIFDDLGAVQG